ncbi:MAG: hypothetical protein APF77_22500 [Clostridia bacterium BRH_c25]|nr:MAG: hypothetical protein APF77_22500 [Clostridia bacterium BRH_c25]
MVFMFAVTLTALVLVAKNNFAGGNLIIGSIASILFVLAIVLIVTTINTFFGSNSKNKKISA